MVTVSYKGFNENVLSFKTELTEAGCPVQISTSNEVRKASKGQDFIGVLISTDGVIGAVQLEGYVELEYTGTTPTLGFCGLVSNGNNGVEVSTTTKHIVRVIRLDTSKKIVGFIL